jgi:DNA-binding SARP family transcriptional activator/tetratricopeptide (TPR) repeat protein
MSFSGWNADLSRWRRVLAPLHTAAYDRSGDHLAIEFDHLSRNMWRLKTFGGIALTRDGEAVSGRTAQRRRLALLAVLAAARNRPVSRDRLLALMWPERDADFARHSLAQLVYGARQQLGDDALISGADDLQLNPARVWSDVAAFEDALDQGAVESAVPLYAGPFLDSFFIDEAPTFERWCEEERNRLRARQLRALDTLATSATRQNDHAKAVEWLRARAVIDPLDSRAAERLVRAMADAGDVVGAIRQAAVHETMLRAELDVALPTSLRKLLDELRQRRDSRPNVTVAPPNASPESPAVRNVAQAPAAEVRRRRPSAVLRAARLTRVTSLAASLIVVAVAATLVFERRGHAASDDAIRLVVLGDMAGPDTLLDLAVREAVRADLESEPALRVLSDADTRETLRLMERSPDAALTPPVAKEIGQRVGAAAVVLGSVTPLGRGVQIVARAVDVSNDRAIASMVERPASSQDVIPAVSRLSGSLRKKIAGARTDSIRPLPAVTTSSLPALREYALARQALARGDRAEARRFAEAAVEQDSLFALALFLAGDLNWFLDRQHLCDAYLRRALLLGDRLPLHERLTVRARYEQLVMDRPDSALEYWQQLHAVQPDAALPYEGMTWVYRAIGEHRKAAATADTALMLDSLARLPSTANRVYAFIAAGDTAAALAAARRYRAPNLVTQARYFSALHGADWTTALNTITAESTHFGPDYVHELRQTALLAAGRFAEAGEELRIVLAMGQAKQTTPRALLAQARAMLMAGGPASVAATAAQSVLGWIEAGDLSPPAIARLTERTCELAARARDVATLQAAERLLDKRDAGRGLRSYRLSRLTCEAALAFARGDMRTAARVAEAASQGMFHGRSLAPIVLLEADAHRALGDVERARTLYTALLSAWPYAQDDTEPWALLRGDAVRALATLH